jgi:hypothetical protein
MKRRDVLQTSGVAAFASLAGCLFGGSSSEAESDPPFEGPSPSFSRSDEVYYPAHRSGMKMIGTTQHSDSTIGLSYTYSERFWTVTGDRTKRVGVEDDYNTLHLMASVWDTETGTVRPVDSGLQVTLERGGETLTKRAMWPMLSQQMGVHFGDNVYFPTEDEYTISIKAGETTVRRLGSLADQSTGPLTGQFTLDLKWSTRNEIPVAPVGSQPFSNRGNPDALQPMEMSMQPLSVVPSRDELPGQLLGTGTSADAEFVLTATDTADGTYLTVSPRTPYNQYRLPLMSLSANIERNGRTVFDDTLLTAIGPDRGYHYGATVDDIESGDKVAISVDLPPQVARHVGYETAFVEMPDVRVTV